MVLYASGNDKSGFVHFKDGEDCFFHTQEMLPQMLDGSEKPMVYYFSPVHFGEKMLGYAVLCRALMQERKADLVYRNFLRHVNIALEMIRAKTKLKLLSVQDEMTGAYNRRGMNIRLEEMLKYAGADEQLIVFVVDMDRLKYINDTFGHTDGDMAIRLISTTAMAATKEGEICVRAGGDEFYIFGVGSYTEKDAAARKQDINSRLKQSGSLLGKPYEITASIGYAIAPAKGVNVDAVLHVADEAMYAEKVAKKVQRT